MCGSWSCRPAPRRLLAMFPAEFNGAAVWLMAENETGVLRITDRRTRYEEQETERYGLAVSLCRALAGGCVPVLRACCGPCSRPGSGGAMGRAECWRHGGV